MRQTYKIWICPVFPWSYPSLLIIGVRKNEYFDHPGIVVLGKFWAQSDTTETTHRMILHVENKFMKFKS